MRGRICSGTWTCIADWSIGGERYIVYAAAGLLNISKVRNSSIGQCLSGGGFYSFNKVLVAKNEDVAIGYIIGLSKSHSGIEIWVCFIIIKCIKHPDHFIHPTWWWWFCALKEPKNFALRRRHRWISPNRENKFEYSLFTKLVQLIVIIYPRTSSSFIVAAKPVLRIVLLSLANSSHFTIVGFPASRRRRRGSLIKRSRVSSPEGNYGWERKNIVSLCSIMRK